MLPDTYSGYPSATYPQYAYPPPPTEYTAPSYGEYRPGAAPIQQPTVAQRFTPYGRERGRVGVDRERDRDRERERDRERDRGDRDRGDRDRGDRERDRDRDRGDRDRGDRDRDRDRDRNRDRDRDVRRRTQPAEDNGKPGRVAFIGNVTYNVFVGDINPDVTESDLVNIFSSCGEISSTLVFRDKITNNPKGFGFVFFKSHSGAEKALSDDFNHIIIKGRHCRVRPEEKSTLLVTNISSTYTEEELTNDLKKVIGECSVSLNNSLMKATVTMPNHQLASTAMKMIEKITLRGKTLEVTWCDVENEDKTVLSPPETRTLFIQRLAPRVDENILKSFFSPYGRLKNVNVAMNANGTSRGFAYVEYFTRENALEALKAMNGYPIDNIPMYIEFSRPKTQRMETSIPRCLECGTFGHQIRECPRVRRTPQGEYNVEYQTPPIEQRPYSTPYSVPYPTQSYPQPHPGLPPQMQHTQPQPQPQQLPPTNPYSVPLAPTQPTYPVYSIPQPGLPPRTQPQPQPQTAPQYSYPAPVQTAYSIPLQPRPEIPQASNLKPAPAYSVPSYSTPR